MKKLIGLLSALLIVFLLTACSESFTDDIGKGNTEEIVKEIYNAGDAEETSEPMENTKEELTDIIDESGAGNADNDGEHEQTEYYRVTRISRAVTSRDMRRFESRHAVSAEQERYLAFGAFVMTNNTESIRVLALYNSADMSSTLLSNYWSVDDRESALTQLELLSSANGQSPVADDIFNTLVKNNQLEPLDANVLLFSGFSFKGLENVLSHSERRAASMDVEMELWMDMLGAKEEDRDEVFELFVFALAVERINSGLEAYIGAKTLLMEDFGFTEEELLGIPALTAWDYGRAAIIARYGVEAGYLEEKEVWAYLKAASDNAADTYNDWREYTAAHILGRALAFGNDSGDFRDTLDFLLNHPESSFHTIDFKIS